MMDKLDQNEYPKGKTISGFSKLSKGGKIKWLVENFFNDPEVVMKELISYWHNNEDQQKIIDGFSENTISNFILPYGVAPNFVINDRPYCIPMVIEESSVVAAAANAAKFWMSRGGFKAKVLDVQKIGQVHFIWQGDRQKLLSAFPALKQNLIDSTHHLTTNMRKRGGGILDIHLEDYTAQLPGYYQLKSSFATCDSMGANFINTLLEEFSTLLIHFFRHHPGFTKSEQQVDIIMSILSNFTPDCLVRAWVECPVHQLQGVYEDMSGEEFADRFHKAVTMAKIDPFRATTHNKGIFNGIDAVVLATGNDFRAIEACGHTYAARSGQYRSLSDCEINQDNFRFWLDIPLAVGTTGGLTSLHPIAKRSLELLENPTADELMQIIAVTGLAQNFAAVKSLVTSGIQKGHMKMHLVNILTRLEASEKEVAVALNYFKDKVVSFQAVRDFLDLFRTKNQDAKI